MRKAPSMTGLRAFDAVLRTGSLSAAARELCVTPAAISHRVRHLEAHFGVALVQRHDGRFVPTDFGQEVLEALGTAFAQIRAAHALVPDDGRTVLRIASSYSFAVLWLAPRLLRFQDRIPTVQLYLDPSHTPQNHQEANVIILHAAMCPPEAGWTLLFHDRCAAVARSNHPIFAAPSVHPAAVLCERLVHISHNKGPAWGEFSWHQWAAAFGIAGSVPATGPTVSAEHLAVDLVLTQDAIALVGTLNAARLIDEGRLAAVPGTDVASGCSYWARTQQSDGAGNRVAETFLTWVEAELLGTHAA